MKHVDCEASIEINSMIQALTGILLTSRQHDLFPLLQVVQHPTGKAFSLLPGDTATPTKANTAG